ncbi:tetratricopeptide repeat protein [Xanthobacteraceae bacterium A53D]
MGRHHSGAAFRGKSGGSGKQIKALEDARRGAALIQAGDFQGAAPLLAASLARDASSGVVHAMYGICLSNTGRVPAALDAMREAARLEPKNASIHADYGALLRATGSAPEKIKAAFERTLALDPANELARAGLERITLDTCDPGTLRDLLAQQPGNGEAVFALAVAMTRAKEDASAVNEVLARGLAAGAITVEEAAVRGTELFHQNGFANEAFALLRFASENKCRSPGCYVNYAILLNSRARKAEAATALQVALRLDPNDTTALTNLSQLLVDTKQYPEALAHLRKILQTRPEHAVANHGIAEISRHICQWKNTADEEVAMGALVARVAGRVPPFFILAAHVPARVHLDIARAWCNGLRVPDVDRLPPAPPADPSRRIRIGYLSSDLHSHATAFLAVELFELHDRERFEVFAYSHSPDDKSEMRARVVAAFDHFIEVGDMTDGEAARRIRADGIDILVDLKGYTKDSRNEILAMRPAPVQVNYLGFPGTMGADFVDYIIGDRFVTPLDKAHLYDEKIVQLPHAYQPNDSRRAIAPTVPSRAACGLPETGFVFCCFNNTYKITPDIFAVWMRLLEAVPDSVLWLFEANPSARDNLYYEASGMGVDPDRIVFAPRLKTAEHLARHVHADLFLDTMFYNAHTTASDALWAGVPLVTVMSEGFAGRVAASLLNAVGLPELVTESLADYEALALSLATDPERLAALKAHLATVHTTAPLFDAKAYTAGIETAFTRMHALRVAGKTPEAISV